MRVWRERPFRACELTNVSCVQSEIANNKFSFIALEKGRKTFSFPFSFRGKMMIIFELRKKKNKEKGKQIKFPTFNGENKFEEFSFSFSNICRERKKSF